jgi:hypothetical protein
VKAVVLSHDPWRRMFSRSAGARAARIDPAETLRAE